MIGPKLQIVPGTDRWVLLEEWEWNGWIVSAGFECNLDSVPRIPGIHSWLKGRSRCGALLHDYLYSVRYERSVADQVFYDCMIAEGVEKRHARPIYEAVKMFGWTRYRD